VRGPTATYRFQVTPSFGFDRVRAQLPRLARLGISHVYLSPVTEAVPGSTHGYDVVDHTRIRDELGGWDGLTALLDDLAGRTMGALIDHVPNHVAVVPAELNARWWAMLRDGAGSEAARWFDVDWDVAGGRVILPVLGEPLSSAVDRLTIVDGELRLGPQRWPLADGTAGLPPGEALARQHYRLQWWREPARNVRRFFTIDGLAGVRVEDPAVATVVDTVPRLLADHPGFAGVRVDHIDGLVDPLGYLERLRAVIGDRWLVVEKILAAGETLPAAWPADGTTGYEHAAVLEHALLDCAGWAQLRAQWAAVTDDPRRFAEWELAARREVLDGGLRPDLERVARTVGDDPLVVEAVEELTVHLGRYRTYLPDPEGEPALAAAVASAAASRPELAPIVERLAAALHEPGAHVEWRARWQQLTGPATAKGVEDRAIWRYGPLASLCEVGGRPEPDPAVDPVAALHDHHASVAARWPRTLLAGTTHDTKRGEDVRAAGLVLAARATQWVDVARAWFGRPTSAVDPMTRWVALQTVLTTPGLDRARLAAFLVKAAREADLHTSWDAPDATFEAAVEELAADVLRWPTAIERAGELDRPGRSVALAMLAVRLTAPGIADIYQGSEVFRYLLVDPDNRVEPDHEALDAMVERALTLDGRAAWAEPGAPAARAVVIARVLPHLGGLTGYIPIDAPSGLIAFARGGIAGGPALVTVVPSALERIPGAVVDLPPGRWRHVLVDHLPDVAGQLVVDEPFDAFPAVVLVRSRSVAPGSTTVGGWEHFTPHLPELVEDPYPAFRWLRHHAPCFHVDSEDIWAVSRYDDVVAAARDPATFSNEEGVGYSRSRVAGLALTNIDPPHHTTLRRLTAGFFTPAATGAHAATIGALLDRLLDDAFEAGQVNVAEAISNPYLSRYVGGLMGIPDADLPAIKDGATAASLRMAGDFRPEVLGRVSAFAGYFAGFVEERQRDMHTGRRDLTAQRDVTDLLFDACPGGYRLRFEEIVQYEVLLATGGNETTAQLLSALVLLIARQPEILQRLRVEPELRPSAVEEALRFLSPVNGLFRHTTRKVDIAGTAVPPDAKVLLLYGSANHDETHYADPDSYRIDRFPRGFADADHVSFTTGIHVCLGAHLARVFIDVLLERFAARVAAIEVTGPVRRSHNALVRVIDDLPTRLVPLDA
jgi:(1->4)-alpha-D-glucan 1-alpha-D-glucosylmutase